MVGVFPIVLAHVLHVGWVHADSYDKLLAVFLTCKLLCIKSSAKWINVNVNNNTCPSFFIHWVWWQHKCCLNSIGKKNNLRFPLCGHWQHHLFSSDHADTKSDATAVFKASCKIPLQGKSTLECKSVWRDKDAVGEIFQSVILSQIY